MYIYEYELCIRLIKYIFRYCFYKVFTNYFVDLNFKEISYFHADKKYKYDLL